ncbi:MAG: type II toxin-antitoxin system RelE/ParE family toxin [Chloroflexi bacterium]|nr:type II toxin-antitoxin system RelE/ParE family toxin [Chloroflexota bacterium]MCI0879353.1 type II toxin-antitoxin system RelE/ParE family toxin [Chloroflexota bacterium]
MASNEPRWHPAAVLDAEEARNWYAERSPFAARGFLLALDDAVRAILLAPARGPLESHGCRGYPLPNRYPYTLIYRLTPDVEVVAVAHQRRRPEYWQRR